MDLSWWLPPIAQIWDTWRSRSSSNFHPLNWLWVQICFPAESEPTYLVWICFVFKPIMKQHIYPDQIWTGLCKSLWWMYLTQIWTLSTMLLNPIWSCYMFGQFQTLYVSFSLCFVCRFVLESMPAVWVICHCLTGSWTLYNRWEDFFFFSFCSVLAQLAFICGLSFYPNTFPKNLVVYMGSNESQHDLKHAKYVHKWLWSLLS